MAAAIEQKPGKNTVNGEDFNIKIRISGGIR